MRGDRVLRLQDPLEFPPGLLCGVDEAGRGPIAGPVTAAAVILNPDRPIVGLTDSKKLTEPQRDALALEIRRHALAWAIATASVEEIDVLNILQASLLAMQRAVLALPDIACTVVVDGIHCPRLSRPMVAVVKADARVDAVSAASILAKTDRDATMRQLDRDFPQYRFERHKGYPTPMHLSLLREWGPCQHHRKSFEPLRSAQDQTGYRTHEDDSIAE